MPAGAKLQGRRELLMRATAASSNMDQAALTRLLPMCMLSSSAWVGDGRAVSMGSSVPCTPSSCSSSSSPSSSSEACVFRALRSLPASEPCWTAVDINLEGSKEVWRALSEPDRVVPW